MKTTLLFLSVFLSASLFGQNVYIPNANFKAYLVGNSEINTNGDNEIQVSEATAFDGAIYCYSQGISDMTGIEAFTALTELWCWGNQLTTLDVSQNTTLTELDCSENQLTTLDVSQNTALTELWCRNNQLTSLDVSQDTALTYLHCGSNQLTSLDVSQNTALEYLNCQMNQLTSLDVTQNLLLDDLFCSNNQLTYLDLTSQPFLTHLFLEGNNLTSLDISHMSCPGLAEANLSNPNLFCIEVSNVECWYEPFTSWMIDPSFQYYSENCTSSVGINQLSTSKNLIQILDLMGRETSFKPNTPLIYVYDDGSIEKVFSVEY